jgi:chromosome segregation ATPase
MSEDRTSELLAQTREELASIKAGQDRLEESLNRWTDRLEADVKDLRLKMEQVVQVSAQQTDHNRRIAKLESAINKVVMTIVLGFVGALIALVTNR